MRKFLYIILSFSIVFSPIFAYAGLPQSVTDYAVSIKNVIKTGVGVTADFAFKKRAANEPEWAAPAKSVSNSKIAGGFLKRFAKFGVGAVGFLIIDRLLDGTDWVMDTENNTITKTGIDTIFFCVPPVAPSTTPTSCLTSPNAYIKSQIPEGTPAPSVTIVQNLEFTGFSGYKDTSEIIAAIGDKDGLNVTLLGAFDLVSYDRDANIKSSQDRTTSVSAYVTVSDSGDVQITPAQLADLLANATASDLETLIQPDPSIDPAEDPAYQDMYADAAAAAEPTDATDPDPEPEPEPEPDPDPDTGECPTGYTKVENLCVQKPQSTDFPDFCSWATPVCDFVDWFTLEWSEFTYTLTALKDWFFETSPSDQDDNTIDTTPVPVVPAQVSIDFVGGCPAPLTFEFSIYNQTFRPAIPFTPICDVAILINPIIKICSTIAAVYIIAGIRQGSN